MNPLHRKTKMKSGAAAFVLTLVALFVVVATPAQAQIPTPTVLYEFQGAPTDAPSPVGAMAQGRDGNLYGTGTARGANSRGGVWMITPAGSETLLVSFPSTYNNCQGLTLGMDGNFYGDCFGGGAHNLGLIYRVTPAGVLTDLHDFDGLANDGTPYLGPPVLGPDGNLYGQTGNPNTLSGSIFRITPAGVYKNLNTLSGGYSLPFPLTFGSDGNLYTTVETAPVFGNRGAVVRITTGGAIKTVYGFVDTTGSFPNSGVIQGTDGKLYGTTSFGGAHGNGTIYKVSTAGAFTELHSTDNPTGPANYNDLLQATNGDFYGAAFGGGTGNQGDVYELTSAGVFSSFLFDQATKAALGNQPAAPLMQHTNGTIFGTNSTGGSPFPAQGTFFSLNIGASPFISLVTPVPAGKEGTKVGILGQGFSTASVVKFGGVKATTVTHTGKTFLLATVPAGALTGKVTVTTGSTTLSTTSTYKVRPTIKAFSPTSGPVGTPVTITGTGLTQATKVTFNGTSTTFAVKSDSKITTTVPTGATSGKIAVTTKGGTITSSTSFTVN
jgi:uncharacterized repeat protein (TIGR03803 family)